MSVYVSPTTGQLIDDDFIGRRIKYSLWQPESKVNVAFFHKKVLKAHSNVKLGLSNEDVLTINGRELREIVRKFYELSQQEQTELIHKRLTRRSAPEEGKDQIKVLTLIRRYRVEDQERRQHKTCYLNDTALKRWETFLELKHEKITFDGFERKILFEYMEWRKNYRAPHDRRSGVIHADTLKKEIGEISRCFRWAYNERIVSKESSSIFKVKIRKDETNTKTIEPLTMEEQKLMLNWLRDIGNDFAHDGFLFLLITGMRAGEWETLEQNSFDLEENVIRLHRVSVGKIKTGGKTASAARVLSITPTIRKLIERGHILERSKTIPRGERLLNVLRWRRKDVKAPIYVWPHRLRHTFATNNVCAKPDEMAYISVRLGHSSISVTMDNYTHFQKMHNHESMRMRFKDHVDWLENNYFEN